MGLAADSGGYWGRGDIVDVGWGMGSSNGCRRVVGRWEVY